MHERIIANSRGPQGRGCVSKRDRTFGAVHARRFEGLALVARPVRDEYGLPQLVAPAYGDQEQQGGD